MVGYPLLSRFVVQIDYRAQHFTLYDPAAWNPSAADGVPLPMELNDNVPSVRGSSTACRPVASSWTPGDSGCVRLYTPFVAAKQDFGEVP